MPSLLILTGEAAGQAFDFEGEVVLGRSSAATLVLPDVRASRQHAVIRYVNGEYCIQDMGSHNGTFLNGQRIEGPTRLKTNDNIRIGVTWLLFTGTATDLEAGDVFRGYKIERKLRKDQTGILYKANQQTLDRDILLWVLSGDCWEEEETITQENFFREIRQIAKLFHPNILMLLDFGASAHFLYCAFEQTETKHTLRKWVAAQQPTPLLPALDIARQIVAAMDYAHRKKVLHLHLTADNILIRRGRRNRVIITEFGFSRFLSEHTDNSMTTTGILGVSEYIAPEQIDCSEPHSAASDIYSFGCILYHLFSGTPPFHTASPYQLMEYHLHQEPIPLYKQRSDLPKELSDFVMKMLHKNPRQRFSSFTEVGQVLEKIQRTVRIKCILNTETGKKFVRKHLRKEIGWFWWILFPALAIMLVIVINLLLP